MLIGHRVEVDILAGTGPALLLALAEASSAPRGELPDSLARALADVGDDEGESWLNLLGVALDAGAPATAERLADAISATDPVELRRHLLGRYAWSWCTLGGVGDIEAAAAGEAGAIERLLAQPRYYAGHARSSLSVLLSVDPRETRLRIAAAIDAGRRTLLRPSAADELAAAGASAAGALADVDPLVALERITRGYRYVPEPEAERVVLVPHLAASARLVLAQHRSARVVAYPATPDRASEERLLALGRALADPKRVEILALVGRGVGRAADLVSATGLTRSTVHHHLGQLRDAGLVALEGNARAYQYVPRREAAADAALLVAEITGTEGE